MKNINSLFALLVLTPGLILAQGSYFRFSIGYGIPAASQSLGSKGTSTSSATGFTSTSEGIYGSLGSGLVFNASYGHMYSKNFGLDIALQYLSGRTYEASQNSTGGFVGSSSSTSSISASGFVFRPSFVMIAGDGNIKPYLKAGLTMGLISAASDNHNSNNFTTIPQTGETHTEYSGGISFGYHGGLGLDFGLSDKANFFTEVLLTSMNYYPDQGEVTVSKVNNVDQPRPYAKTIFKESVTTNSGIAPPAPGSPTESLQVSMPLSSISLNAGIRIFLKSKVKPSGNP